jgi:hypothetical protein
MHFSAGLLMMEFNLHRLPFLPKREHLSLDQAYLPIDSKHIGIFPSVDIVS